YVTVGRSVLSQLIFKKATSGIETIFGDEIAEIEDGPRGVKVKLKKNGERHFDLVVGADGLHSNVRRLVFGAENRFEKYLGYAVAAFEVNNYPMRDESAYVMYCEPGRMIGRVTLRDNKTLFLCVFVDKADVPIHDLPSQKRLLRERYGACGWE